MNSSNTHNEKTQMDDSCIIFLDVDGVLNDKKTTARSPNGFIGINGSMLRHLADLVWRTGAKIILTSTWTSEWEPSGEIALDGRYLIKRLESVGIKIADRTADRIHDRGAGIRRYLDAHPEIKSWVVLDDDVFSDYQDCGIMDHLIQTSFYSGGLTEKLAERAFHMLTD